MRWLVFLVATAAVLVGAAFAFAGESGGGGKRAFALVDPSGPRLVDAHTRGFDAVSVGPAGPGDYCLTPSEGVDVVDTAAVASTEAFFSNLFGIASVRYQRPIRSPGGRLGGEDVHGQSRCAHRSNWIHGHRPVGASDELVSMMRRSRERLSPAPATFVGPT